MQVIRPFFHAHIGFNRFFEGLHMALFYPEILSWSLPSNIHMSDLIFHFDQSVLGWIVSDHQIWVSLELIIFIGSYWRDKICMEKRIESIFHLFRPRALNLLLSPLNFFLRLCSDLIFWVMTRFWKQFLKVFGLVFYLERIIWVCY